jgi:thymidylate synthase/7-cyano-7-deazaguanine synthase in queuosine biosynthesis
MKIVKAFSIGDAWQESVDLILKNGLKIYDDNQELMELLNLYILIESPNENDPVASNQDDLIKSWMDENFTKIQKVPELNNSWSYGWRLYDFQGVNQIEWVINKLKIKPESKSATISMIQKAGIEEYIPCVSLLDFKIRDQQLLLSVTCRSLDFGKKAIHNLTNLSSIGKQVADSLNLEHFRLLIHVISAHIYTEDSELDMEKKTTSENYWKYMLAEGGKQYKKNVESLKEVLKVNRGYVFEIPKDEHIVLLCSGGMDSITLIDLVIRQWNCKVILIYYKRKSKNQRWEEESVDFFYKFFKESFPENMLELIKIDIEIPLKLNKEYLDRTRQIYMGLPLRNTVMWDNSFAQAVYLSGKYKKTIRTVIVGSVEEDLTSPESGILAIISQNLHTCIAMGVWYYQLLGPFLDDSLGHIYNKLDLLKYAEEYQIPIEKSRSCFGPDEKPCNECLACQNRNNAYNQLKDLKE